MTDEITRRRIMAVGAAAGLAGAAASASAATFGNPDEPPQGAANAKSPQDLTIPGPHDDALSKLFPSDVNPPSTDQGDLPEFWATFNNAPRRIQDGGWARQVTSTSFPIATEISGVDMRLAAGAIRELHWHQAAEWAYVTYGTCRVTLINPKGQPYVADVKKGGLWYFPAGWPHSLQGLGPDGTQFVLCFDNGAQSEFNTLLLTQWMAHTPPDVLAESFNTSADAFKRIPLHDLYIFPSALPQPLAVDEKQMESPLGPPPNPFTFDLEGQPPVSQSKGGTVRIADSKTFHASTTVAAALVTIHPGGLRPLHWHPNADEWQYWMKGKGQMSVFDTGPKAVTTDFRAGDIGYVKRNFGHYIKNTGDEDLVLLTTFRTAEFQEIELSNWLTHLPRQMIMAHLGVSAEEIDKWPTDLNLVLPL